jgi:hypothetical protein
MAQKKITSEPYTVTLPGGSPLYFKTETTYNTDTNGNPIRGSSLHTVLYSPNGSNYIPSATTTEINGQSNNWTLLKYTPEQAFSLGITQYLQPDNSVLGPTAALSLQTYDGQISKETRNTISKSSIKAGNTVGQTQAVLGTQQTVPNQGGAADPNAPTDPANPTDQEGSKPLSKEEVDDFNKQLESIKTNQRQNYESAKYPLNLQSEYQDCIKFSVVKYQQSGLEGFGPKSKGLRIVEVDESQKGRPKIGTREILATIVLPIPGGIQDGNQVNWSGTDLNDIQKAFGDLAQTGITGGNVAGSAQKSAEEAAKPGSGVRTAIISKLTEAAIGQGGLMQRQFGTIINPNTELLFSSPYLRTFSFSFKLSPRSSKEAEEVRKIIRNFKQAMSPKRSESSFLLQSPHTFAISYIFQNKQHPYLNRFKECALTSCNVNYTPEGNYMAFDDSNQPSMVSYQLDLQFQELEPLYDDDYGDGYTNMGY